MNKHDVAKVLDEIGVLLELQGANPFRVRAYHNAAHSIENLDENILTVVEEERLEELPAIGKDLAEKITTLVRTGKLPYYEKLKKSMPESLLELMNIPGLGAKKIKTLYEKLGIKTLEELTEACQKGKIAKLRGFGEKTQENIQKGLLSFKNYGRRTLWWNAQIIAQKIFEPLSKLKDVKKAEIAGSLRRTLETIGDLDFVVASSNPKPIMQWFTKQEWVDQVLAIGPTKASVRLKKGIQADLRIVPEEQYAFALLYFTGSKSFNIKMRQRANAIGLTLNEYTFESLEPKIKTPFSKRSKKIIQEEDIFKVLGLSYIPPELREDMGEIEAAEKGKLPKLVEYRDIKGVFHCHTTDSDGHHTLEEMVSAAQKMKWDYIGISDHSKSSFQANGMDEERLSHQLQRIQKLNQSRRYSIHVFAGLECDIMNDGKLDFPNSLLKELDFVIVSIHRSFRLDEKKMTARLIKAIENPYTTMMGHLTGRLLLKREPYALNIPKIIDACIANHKIIELNASPLRLDLDWRFWHKAAEKGLKCCINPDAHRIEELEYYKAGVRVARKGWLEAKSILNTLSLAKIKKYLTKSE